jgi:hypothetical protein
MKVRMTEYKQGSNDGINTLEFKVGMEYSVPTQMSEYLAKAWVSQGAAEIVTGLEPKEKKVIEPTEIKEEVEKKTTKRRRTTKKA